MIIILCVIKDNNKFYRQIFLEEALVAYEIISVVAF